MHPEVSDTTHLHRTSTGSLLPPTHVYLAVVFVLRDATALAKPLAHSLEASRHVVRVCCDDSKGLVTVTLVITRVEWIFKQSCIVGRDLLLSGS